MLRWSWPGFSNRKFSVTSLSDNLLQSIHKLAPLLCYVACQLSSNSAVFYRLLLCLCWLLQLVSQEVVNGGHLAAAAAAQAILAQTRSSIMQVAPKGM
jgi:hypothetical protein